MRIKTTGLVSKSCRPHNFKTTKVISTQLVSHILKIRQAEPIELSPKKWTINSQVKIFYIQPESFCFYSIIVFHCYSNTYNRLYSITAFSLKSFVYKT